MKLRDGHLPPRPRDHRVGFLVEHVGEDASHALLLLVEAVEQGAVGELLEGRFPFLEAAGLRHGIAVQERLEVPDHFDRDSRNVRRDLMRGPSVACAHGRRRGGVDGREEGLGLVLRSITPQAPRRSTGRNASTTRRMSAQARRPVGRAS